MKPPQGRGSTVQFKTSDVSKTEFFKSSMDVPDINVVLLVQGSGIFKLNILVICLLLCSIVRVLWVEIYAKPVRLGYFLPSRTLANRLV